jgi:hypothetical protein
MKQIEQIERKRKNNESFFVEMVRHCLVDLHSG